MNDNMRLFYIRRRRNRDLYIIIQNSCFVTLATVRREGRRSTIKDPVTAGEAGTVSGSRLPGIKRVMPHPGERHRRRPLLLD